jgi:translation elongation factor EF-Tu-like GTPase
MADQWITVELELLPSEQGGRSTGVGSGWGPLLRFNGADDLYGMVEVFLDGESVDPGSSASGRLRVAAPERLPTLRHGDRFDVLEGLRVVGRGKVVDPGGVDRDAR